MIYSSPISLQKRKNRRKGGREGEVYRLFLCILAQEQEYK